MAFGRFLASQDVTSAGIFDAAARDTAERAAGRSVIAIQDTTTLSFPNRRDAGLGPGPNGSTPSLLLHPVLTLDATSGVPLGLAGGLIWTRPKRRAGDRTKRPIEKRESFRWIKLGLAAREALGRARHVTLVADRESDIYEEWAEVPGENFDLITRVARDRKLAGGGSMFEKLAAEPYAGTRSLQLTATRNRNARTALLSLRLAEAVIERPERASCTLPERLALRVVEVIETAPPRGQDAVHWRLMTTLPVATAEAAWRVVDCYRMRWQIEEYNRTLKKSGLDLEEAMTEGAHALANLVAMAAVAAVAVMQLVRGRDAGPGHRASEVATKSEERCATDLCPTLEGKTQKQKNPHAAGSLAWLAWIIARLGGWSGYERYAPPGPKTMAAGWRQFNSIHQGWGLRKNV